MCVAPGNVFSAGKAKAAAEQRKELTPAAIPVAVALIAFENGGKYMIMYNPKIVGTSGEYKTEEGCLSYLGGPVKTTRHKSIQVEYEDEKFKKCKKVFKDYTAQIIQHEIDHTDGVLI